MIDFVITFYTDSFYLWRYSDATKSEKETNEYPSRKHSG